MSKSPDSPKRPRGVAGMKMKYEEQVADRDAKIAELEAKLARQEAAEYTGVTVAPSDSPTVTVESASESLVGGPEDPLRWIDAKTDRVYLVSCKTTLPGHSTPNRRNKPEDFAQVLWPVRMAVWAKNPYHLEGRTQDETNNLRLMNKHHAHYIVESHYARRFYDAPAQEIPTKVIVRPQDFQGLWEHSMEPRGEHGPMGEFVPLRELIRWYLQRFRNHLWFDKSYYMKNPLVDEAEPNPYSRGYRKSSGPIHRVNQPTTQEMQRAVE